MCGIFGYIGPRTDAPKIVLEGLKSLEYRGYDSWGVAVVAHNTIVVKKKTGKIGDATVADMPKSSFALGHTRWATHGGVTDINAHPHLDCTRTIAVVHNGIVENYENLKKQLIAKGHRFISETDTEVIAHLIENHYVSLKRGGLKGVTLIQAVRTAFLLLQGLNAVIVIDTKSRQFIAIRNGSPLVIGFGKNENYLASDPAALLPHTRVVQFLEDGEMAIVEERKITFKNVKTGKGLPIKKQKLNWTVSQSDKGNYPHFMLKEIHEQPEALRDIAKTGATGALRLARAIKKSYGTYMVGCGSASYACLAGSYLFSKIAKRHVNWAIGSEFGYHLNFLTPKSTVIAISQSGETMDILESVKKAKTRGAVIVAIVNVLGSTLYRLADDKVLIGVGPEKAVASTKALTGMIAHLLLLSWALAGDVKKGQAMLAQAALVSEKLLKNKKHFATLVQKLKDVTHIYVIGRGLSYPAALEAAIKIKEISYIHAEGMAAGELKHGPLALVEKGTPCIAFLPNDETYGANLAGAMEMKARGGYIIGISFKPHEVFDYYIPVKDCREATLIPNVIVAQLLAYYLTLERGLDPDMPRNLAKSVTVK
ncbi:glutamine--fructose-6-phosphate transaminase (isomerizing) [Candidatus Gottesmanbacteria bacterium]|nr:glutamine--fructose-6-phosphate transaminase (isomerizing) [Candidatus Gottesmanbacteria bacterium]